MKNCISCDQPAAPNRARCPTCLAQARAYMRDYNRERRSQDLCIECGKPTDGKPCCPSCTARRRESERKRTTFRLNHSLCTKCNKPVQKLGQWRCTQCAKKHRQYIAKRKLEHPYHKTKIRDNFRCRICSKSHRLFIHHINGQGERSPDGQRQKPDNRLENLITLCPGCHGALTRFINAPDSDLVIQLILQQELKCSDSNG